MTTAIQSEAISLEGMLRDKRTSRQKLEAFALLNLGVHQSLLSGVLTADSAVARFYNSGNCRYVRRRLKHAECDEIMSRGVQLADLFDVLPPAQAHREFARELDAIRTLCLKLLATVERRPGNNRS